MIAAGVDIVAIGRFSGKAGDSAFLERLLTETEMTEVGAGPYAERRLAVRFAAKEAVMKALGTGWDKGVGWRDIEVVSCPQDGATRKRAALRVRLHNKAKAFTEGRRIFLSVSETGALAIAFVVMEGSDEVPDNNPRL